MALEADPGNVAAHSHLLTALNYGVGEGTEPEAVFAEHRRWEAMHATPLRRHWRAHANERAPERRLKVGYLSPDVAQPDAVTEQLRRAADHWRPVAGLAPAVIAELVGEDAIDVLVDLAGHTWPRSMLVLARKPAPVQVTWLGYGTTTGMSAVDWRLTDATADPPGEAERLHAETLVRLPKGFHCYRPPADAPEPRPATGAGPVTFGSFNNVAKITPAAIAAWSRLLEQVAGSRLVLKYRGLDDPGLAARLGAAFAAEGVDAGRIVLRGRDVRLGDHFAAYREIDVALDTFPYNGTTTTCEALWMGVPVVTLAAGAHVGRVGASLLKGLGLAELVAGDERDYVERAAALATDAERRAAFHATLRERMAAAALMDAESFARALEAAYREMWRDWCVTSRTDGGP